LKKFKMATVAMVTKVQKMKKFDERNQNF
jgi:hypothetical protein